MDRPRVLALILAGGEGGRMDVLSARRAKPALPYGGVFRLIDLPLSNLRNSAVDDVWLVLQYEAQTLIDVVAGGRPWDLDRTRGGLRMVTPEQRRRDGADDDGWHEGNADAIYRCRHLIAAFSPDVLLVLSADHVYRLDFGDVVAAHLENDAELTVVSTKVAKEDATHHGVIEVDDDGRVTGFEHKPEDPSTGTVTTEVFAYSAGVLLETLDQLVEELGEESELGDFGDHLVPRLIGRGKVFDFPLEGYWRDLGRPETYFAAHMELLEERPEFDLDDPAWPIFTKDRQRRPARIRDAARIVDSLVSPGCDIAGTVRRSVLGPGVVVGKDAVIENAVIMADVEVRAEAEVRYALIDDRAVIGKGAILGATPDDEVTADSLVLVGMEARVRGGRKVAPGARVDPPTPR